MASPPPRVWIDVDNPPQVQYLAPIAEELARRGSELVVTARDHGIAHQLLEARGLPFHPVGAHPGRSTAAKTVGVMRRAASLVRLLRRDPPDVAVFATRAAAIAAPVLRIPGVALLDYEHADLRAYRLARTWIVHPAVLAPALRELGFNRRRLVAYEGIKEDITFAGADLGTVEPYDLGDLGTPRPTVVLVRPPDDRSHYHREASSSLTRAALERLARRRDVLVVLSPRYPDQVSLWRDLPWQRDPVALEGAAPFLSLLSAVDIVVTGGGTMAREAAYLGVPAYSVFRGEIGAVDRLLVSLGRLTVLDSQADLQALDGLHDQRRALLALNPRAVEDVADAVVAVVT